MHGYSGTRSHLEVAKISSYSIAKLSKDENVNVDILDKICTADVSDIIEIMPDEKTKDN